MLGKAGVTSKADPGQSPPSGSCISNHTYSWLTQDCYILDQSGTKIYVWKGKGATKVEKQAAMSKALVGAVNV